MDARSDGHNGARRAAGAPRRSADEHGGRPVGAGAEPRRRDPEDRPGWHRTPGGTPVNATPSPDPAQPTSSEPAKSAGWLIVAVVITIVALLLLPWFIFSVVVAAPIVLVVLGVAAAVLAARRRRRSDWPASRL